MKRIFAILLLLAFIIVSVLFISPEARMVRAGNHSSQLNKVSQKNGHEFRTDYVDSEGRLTIATDLGYATIIVHEIERDQIEEYYDATGKPVSSYAGYYKIYREYDENGNNIRNTYMSIDNNPVMTINGYAIEERQYNNNGQAIFLRYYDTKEQPVDSSAYGYGRILGYDDKGRINKITYIDNNGEPTKNKQGYVTINLVFYDTEDYQRGRVESEYYYDENSKPIELDLGQYGVHKEYDQHGNTIVLVYLNAAGEPIKTKKGYTTVVRTYYDDNTVETEKYYDSEGKPFSLSEGQYGIMVQSGKTEYLNENGKKYFNLRNEIYNHAWLIIPLTIFIVILSSLINKKWNVILMAVYILFVFYFTLLYREDGGKKETELFWYYKRIVYDSGARADILKNIWLFIPFGGIFYHIYPKKSALLIPILLSILIEGIQNIASIGFCEIDDIISNGLGGWIGLYSSKLTTDFIQRINIRHIYSV